MKNAVPVIMYHTVGIQNPEWQWHHLTIPYKIFENQLKTLKKHNYHTITLSELHEYIFNSKPIPKKSIVLTFDDGYLDNWLFAYPLLKKYNFKGTIYVNPEFMEVEDIVRTRYDENPQIINMKNHFGFLSWAEMRIMEKSGHIDIQSHAMSHTWYEISEKLIDFRHPGDPYIWMTWNSNKDKKPSLQVDNPELVKLGEPVYEHDKSLGAIRILPDKDLSEKLVKYVKEKGCNNFFKNRSWRKELTMQYNILKSKSKDGLIESNKEALQRFEFELVESKNIIEQKLNKKVDFFCWPGGGACKDSVQIAQKHYISSTAARDIKKTRKNIYNSPNEKINRIQRLSPDLFWNGKTGNESRIKYAQGLFFMMLIMKFKTRNKYNVPRILIRLIKIYFNILFKIKW